MCKEVEEAPIKDQICASCIALHSTVPQDFLKHILNKPRDDIVGTICKQDQIIVKLGIIFYGRIKRKGDKKIQVSMQVLHIHDGFSKAIWNSFIFKNCMIMV